MSKESEILGEEAAFAFEKVKQDLIDLRLQWRIYRTFFGTNQERIEMLNRISPTTAFCLERALFESTLVKLRKLADRTERRNKKSATISLNSLKVVAPNEREFLSLLAEARKTAEFASDWVGKRIAHNDEKYLRGQQSLKPASRAAVENAIESAAKVIRWIGLKKLEINYVTHTIAPAEDEHWFLLHLFEGEKAFVEKERLSRKYSSSGKYSERDELYRFPNWISEPPPDEIDID